MERSVASSSTMFSPASSLVSLFSVTNTPRSFPAAKYLTFVNEASFPNENGTHPLNSAVVPPERLVQLHPIPISHVIHKVNLELKIDF